MSTRNSITDFKDLRKAIEEVQKNKPAQSRYQLQAEKMNYMQEAADEKDDKKDSGLLKRKDHAGEEEIKKAYLALGTEAQGSVEYQRGLIQKELAKMGYKTYSKYAFDSIFKFENNIMRLKEVSISDKDIKKEFPLVWKQKDKRLNSILMALVNLHGYNSNHSSYLVDKDKFLKTLQRIGKDNRSLKKAGLTKRDIGESAFDDMKDIVKTKGAKKVGGIMVDMFTASVITQAYDKVNDANKKKMEKANVQTLVKLAQKVMGMKEELKLDEGKMSDLLIDIQQGATAKELAKDFKIPLSVAKGFLQDYYGQKKGSRKEGFASDAQRRAAFASGYKEKGKKKKESVDERFNQSVQGGKRLVDFEVFLDSKDIEKALKTLSTNLKKDRVSFNPKMKNVKGSPGNFDVLINAIDEEDRWRLIVIAKKEVDLTSSFKMIQKLPSAKFKAMYAEENVQEGTWAIPKTSKEKKLLKDLMKKPLPLGKDGDSAIERIASLIGDDSLYDDLNSAGKKNPNTDARPIIKKAMKRLGIKEEVSREDQLKEERTQAKQSPFKLKSQQYPRAVAIDTIGFGNRHATGSDITEACDSFGMITDQELQIEQIQKQLGKKGFISYTNSDLQDVFEDRETQRMIYALESIVEDQETIEYTKDQVEDSYIMSEEIEFVKPDGQKTAGPVLKVCENTFNVKDKYTGKSFTYKYIGEENKVKSFREITEAKFSAKLIKQAGGIAFDKRYYMGNMTGAMKAIEKLKKGLSDDPKVKDMLRIANESFNNKFFEALTKEDQEAYVKFFKSALKKFGVNSPAELDDNKKKEFFNYIDKNYTAKDEVKEGKYTKYSDLLLQRARAIADSNKLNSPQVKKIDKLIAKEMKRLGMGDVPDQEQQENINHKCATHVEHAVFGSGETVSGQHTLVQEESGEYVVTHYDVEFDHGLEEMVSVKELAVTKQESHAHAMAKKAGRKKIKANWSKKEQSRIDGRRKNFREKMIKLGYIKGR